MLCVVTGSTAQAQPMTTHPKECPCQWAARWPCAASMSSEVFFNDVRT